MVHEKMRLEEKLLRHLFDAKCEISRNWEGASKSGYMRCRCLHRVWPRPLVDKLFHEKALKIVEQKIYGWFKPLQLSTAGKDRASVLPPLFGVTFLDEER